MTDTTVKFFSSAMAGAPVLNGVAGSLIGLLDTTLINGFGLKVVDTLVVASNTATANISTGHSAVVGSVVLISGAVPAGLNGEQRVTAVSTTSLSFATTAITDQTATGSITLKLAGAGWAKAFTSTNLAAYKSANTDATGCYLRVDDTNARFAKVVGYEVMTDVDTGTGPFPTVAQRATGKWWAKSASADTVARPWLIAADSRMVYLMVSSVTNSNSNSNWEIAFFGDIISVKTPSDPKACVLFGSTSDTSTDGPNNDPQVVVGSASSAASEIFIARSHTGLGAAQQLTKMFALLNTGLASPYSGRVTGGLPYPNPTNNGLYLTPFNLTESASLAFRGVLPGIFASPQLIPSGTFSTGDKVQGAINGVAKNVLVHLASNVNSGITAFTFFDLTGPWR